MIEDVSKLINGTKTTTNNYVQTNIKVYYQKDIDELLKYKNAWEELKVITHKITKSYDYGAGYEISDKTLEELETKNGIEVK